MTWSEGKIWLMRVAKELEKILHYVQNDKGAKGRNG